MPVWKKSACLELELIKAEDGDDKAKWEHLFSFSNFNTASVCLQFDCIDVFLQIWEKSNNAGYTCIRCQPGAARRLLQRGWCDILSASKGAATVACRTSSPLFQSFPLSISYHLCLSCAKPDEGHLTNVPAAMQKSSILAALWPVNISTLHSWQDLPLLCAQHFDCSADEIIRGGSEAKN